jgi:uncharacterized protein
MSPRLVLRFVAACRAAGMRISTAEVLDSLTALELIDVLQEEDFRTLLRANYAKSRREQSTFDRIYHLFFHEMQAQIPTEEAELFAARIDGVLETLEAMGDGGKAYRAILDFLRGDSRSYLAHLAQMRTEEAPEGSEVKFNWASMVGRLEVMVQLNTLRDGIARFLGEDRFLYSGELRRSLAGFFQQRLESAYSLLLREPRPYDDGQGKVKRPMDKRHGLGERPFSQLSEREIAEMREIIAHLVRKLKDMVTLRWAARSRGVLDAKKTLRRSARYHGVPLEIIYRRRPPRKGRIVTLCDVSGSVWSAARFMLTMVYSLQECFEKVQSFVFVSGMAEVTEILAEHEINAAVDSVLCEADLDYLAATDYGESFRHFKHAFIDRLTKKTTLIILGDARSNYYNPEEGILGEMRDKCRRLIWLNPEPEQVWNTGDSEMHAYLPYCHEVRPCRNLNQLTAFIRDLV